MRLLFRIAAPLLVALIGYWTFMRGYAVPQAFFWDENYHVAAAQKYLNHVFFMEPHPPLGKLLIALGEDIVKANAENAQFIGTDYGKNPPTGFSFAGYRFFPALFGWLTAVLVYFLLLEISGSPIRALLLSSLYLFENSFIVHFRGAMLDSIQLFFIVATILLVFRARNGRTGIISWLLLGAVYAAALGSKSNAILLAPLLALPLFRLRGVGTWLTYAGSIVVAALITTTAIWWYAASLGQEINPSLEHKGWYDASPELKAAVTAGDRSLRTAYLFLRDSLKFQSKYHSRVPRLNYCKVDENGSYPLLWPIGARSINYRWERDGETIRYLYLQANPFIWLVALAGLLGGAALLCTRALGERTGKLPHEDLLATALLCYGVYLGATLSVDRVFYLYHYFMPLLLCLVAAAILIEDLKFFQPNGGIRKNLFSALLAFGAYGSFHFYSPLTYYEPITEAQFTKRSLLPLWDLFWVGRPKENPMARPMDPKRDSDSKNKESWTLELGGLRSLIVTQSWGSPRSGTTVDGNPPIVQGKRYYGGFGVHATSSIDFPVAKGFSRFTAKAGIPDEVAGTQAAVKFRVLGDGAVLWESPISKAGDPPIPVDVDIRSAGILTLSVIPAGESIDNAHANWLDPMLVK